MEAKKEELYPKRLYRYYRWKDGIEMLATQNIKIKAVSSYNDPFEFFPASKYTDKLSNYTIEELKKIIEDIIVSKKNSFTKEDIQGIGGLSSLLLGSLGIFSFGTLLPLVASVMVGSNLYDSHKKNEIEEVNKLKLFISSYLSFIQNVKTCCFSEQFNNVLMWSHYAEKHEGMVISYNPSILFWGEDYFKKVEYSDKRVSISLTDSDSNAFVSKLITTKGKCWEYEKEWRLIKYNAQNINTIRVNPQVIDCIYLGLRVSEEKCQEVKGIRDSQYPNAIIKRASMDKDSFNLVFKRIV